MTSNDNAKKLLWLVRTFGLSVRNISRLTGFSPAYVSRASKGGLEPSSDFLLAVERRLPEIMGSRQRQFFDIPAVTLAQLEKVSEPDRVKVA
jgi:hypothetical protein